MRRSVGPIARGSILGFFVGLIPGPATVISTFVSYALEKRVSKNSQEFGHGAVEGLVGPESANNSACVGSMIPLLTLGIPFNAPSAVLLAGLLMHNVEPGPLLFQNAPQVFWTYIAALYIGNCVLLFLNLPLVGIFARVATIRPMILMPVVSTDLSVGRLLLAEQYVRRLGHGRSRECRGFSSGFGNTPWPRWSSASFSARWRKTVSENRS